MIKLAVFFVHSPPGERAHDARRPSGGNRKSHPVVGGISLTPRYSPRPRLDNIRPAAAPPEEPPDLWLSAETKAPNSETNTGVNNVPGAHDANYAIELPVSETPAGQPVSVS
ncbi:unnamed protein product [Parnassius apollo]|uniref:(apollo) hypothetical protein n=1 Tax=Parnassius apollo TaxID=110799 RepID=A0A8S3WZG8_PARAO|nr:unnamed protein product [Parnassius apollo]